MSDWSKGYQDGIGGAPPPTGSVEYAGWAAAQALRRENEERLRSNSGSGSSPGDVSFAPSSSGAGDYAYTGPADPQAAVAGLKGLVLFGALAVFSPITIPAAVAAILGAPALMLMLKAPRPHCACAFPAAFAGFIVYMASVGAAVALAAAMTGSVSLLPVTPKVVGAIAIGQVAALAGFACVSTWWIRRRLPTMADVVRALIAGLMSVVLFLGAVLGAAWKLGIA